MTTEVVERRRHHHVTMCRIRAFEEAAAAAARDGLVPGPVHPSIGQEAVAAGICTQLRPDDVLFSTHRGHGHAIAKGAAPAAMMRELLGRRGGVCSGKGGSMHIADFGVGMFGANGVVGDNITIAAGAAHAVRLQGEARVVVCIFGDGAVNRGPFLEGLNWARVYDLPVLFVCEDNAYAATTPTRATTGGPGVGARAESIGIPATTVDGNDVLAVEEAAADLLASVRAGRGPFLLHALTYRLAGHTAVDTGAYRDEEEVAAGRRGDPIGRNARALHALGVPESETERIRSAATAEMRTVLAAALAAPPPEPSLAWRDVQDVGAPREVDR